MREGVAPFTGAWIEMLDFGRAVMSTSVAPFTGAWIEIPWLSDFFVPSIVAPFTGAWIEITKTGLPRCQCQSLPSRGRGLKY